MTHVALVKLRNCRNPVTGTVDDWAAEIVASLQSYTEVDLYGTGVQVFCLTSKAFPFAADDRVSIQTLTPEEGRAVMADIARLGAK